MVVVTDTVTGPVTKALGVAHVSFEVVITDRLVQALPPTETDVEPETKLLPVMVRTVPPANGP